MNGDTLPNYMREALATRERDGGGRSIEPLHSGIDLCSNDYLGIARGLAARLIDIGEDCSNLECIGSTGSRLVSGSSELHDDTESLLARHHRGEAALLFGSGYEANLGLVSCLGQRGDTVIYDSLVHASLRDGLRLGAARSYNFKHNDLDDLNRKISAANGDVFVVTESIFSMDGDLAPLREMAELCRQAGARLIVDEAHSNGLYGPGGAGMVSELGLEANVFARVYTFGKAIGFRGACVVASSDLIRYLINFSRPFIYSTACDAMSLLVVQEAYRLATLAEEERRKLFSLIESFRSVRALYPNLRFLDSSSPIQGVIIPGNNRVSSVERSLREKGFQVRAIRAPTVPAGAERLRISLHAFNTEAEIQSLLHDASECVAQLCVDCAPVQGTRL